MGNTHRIIDALEGAYKTTKVDRFVEVRSRCLFPDGHPASVYIPVHDPRLVMDLGETMRWIRTRTGHRDRRGRRKRRLIGNICVSRDLEFAHEMFFVRVSSVEELGQGIDRLSRAMVWLAEMWLKDDHLDGTGQGPATAQ